MVCVTGFVGVLIEMVTGFVCPNCDRFSGLGREKKSTMAAFKCGYSRVLNAAKNNVSVASIFAMAALIKRGLRLWP